MEQVKAQSEIRIGELVIEKSELKERLVIVERLSFTLKKERDDAVSAKESAEAELKIVKYQLDTRLQEFSDTKTLLTQV